MQRKTLKEILEFNVHQLVDNHQDVEIEEVGGGSSIILDLTVAKADFGKVVGKGGRTADAIRKILYCVASRQNVRCVLEINEK